ncbi:ABC transporter ATP-binding protein [Lysinibacillus alkalisoli]|uniref:ABC transporter ATP-binding protein n=1 Tax=Lysinibacillus alkalisoli TaxID=1911548 RepID=A0A917G6X1_9BACI|nr:LytTR family transcriptional regulator DNA-binding domain-containing protein [Lysinibacillus alkalisoli]GGG25252.1 ABC transporter ATP-binding protein [Lysinibacillus alkalisoli]
MSLVLQKYTADGSILLPTITLPTHEQQIIGIHADVKRVAYFTTHFANHADTFVLQRTPYLYRFLRVKEYFSFLIPLYDSPLTSAQLIKMMQVTHLANQKLNTLTYSEKKVVQSALLFLTQENYLLIEEPFQNIDEANSSLLQNIFHKVAQNKDTMLLSSNFHEVVSGADVLYKLNERGLHHIETENEVTPHSETDIKFEKIPTRHEEKIMLFNPPEIDYIESLDGQVYVYVNGDAFQCSLTLQQLEQRLLPFGFFRCHRSYIVNLQKVREIITWTRNSYSLVLTSDTTNQVPLSKKRLTTLKSMLGI